MRNAVLIVALLLVSVSMLLAQSPRRKRQPAKPNIDRRAESRCGVVQSAREFVEELKVEWREAGATADENFLYNTRKMDCDDKGILKVWIKIVSKDTPKPLVHEMQRIQLNCRLNQMRFLSTVKYKKDGSVLDLITFTPPKWEDIIPDSVGENIWQTVCHKTL